MAGKFIFFGVGSRPTSHERLEDGAEDNEVDQHGVALPVDKVAMRRVGDAVPGGV